MRILQGLKSFVFNEGSTSLKVFILEGLKSFVLIQIRDALEVLILQGLQARFLEVRILKGLGFELWRTGVRGGRRLDRANTTENITFSVTCQVL